MVAAALRQGRARPGRGHAWLLFFCPARPARSGAHRRTNMSVSSRWSARFTSFPAASTSASRAGPRRSRTSIFLLVGAVIANLLGTTGAAMLLIRPWIRMNQVPRHGASHRLFHFHRGQRRRLPYAHRRSAAVPRLPAGRAVLVGRGKLLADVGWSASACCWPFFMSWTGKISPARRARCAQETVTRNLAVRRPAQPVFPGRDSRARCSWNSRFSCAKA